MYLRKINYIAMALDVGCAYVYKTSEQAEMLHQYVPPSQLTINHLDSLYHCCSF